MRKLLSPEATFWTAVIFFTGTFFTKLFAGSSHFISIQYGLFVIAILFCGLSISLLFMKFLRKAPHKKRHWIFTVFLILSMLGNFLVSIGYLFVFVFRSHSSLDLFLFLLNILNYFCAFAIVEWKKWAVYATVLSACILFYLNLLLKISLPLALFGLISSVAVFFLARLHWHHFKK